MRSIVRQTLRLTFPILASAILLCTLPALAQQAPTPTPAPAPAMATKEANPISTHLRGDLAQSAKNFVAAADEMPADKYSFQPTPEQMTFAHLVSHVIQANYGLCAAASGATKPDVKVADTDGKDKLMTELKASYDFCTTNLANADDSNLGEVVPLGKHAASRGAIMMIMSAEFADHYSMAAMYLRLSGLLPPTAKK